LASDRNRSIGDTLSEESLSASWSAGDLSIGFCRFFILLDQLSVGQPPSSNRRYHLSEPTAVVLFAFVKPKGLLIEIGVKVSRVNADIGTFAGPLQETPEVFNIVGMDVAIHEFR
jgi:hypothetical protein